MFDFRYHALSLVAVFVALVVGLLMGITIGDEGLVSKAENGLRANLKRDVANAQKQASSLRTEVQQRDRYADATFPALVADRLSGRRVTLLFLDDRNESIFEHVRDAVTAAGGSLGFTATVRAPLDLEGLAGAAAGTRYAQVAQDPTLVKELGRRAGGQFVTGGRLLANLRDPLLSNSNGELGPSEAIVIARSAGERITDPDARRTEDALIDGLIAGMREQRVPVVGVEETSTDPSQISFYRGHGIASVDDVDEVAGRVSMVFALAGSADGAYGVKATRDALLPDALVSKP